MIDTYKKQKTKGNTQDVNINIYIPCTYEIAICGRDNAVQPNPTPTHLKSMLPASWNAPPSSLWYPYEQASHPGILPLRGKRLSLTPMAMQSGIA